jgi:excisionase family DNA binding protein
MENLLTVEQVAERTQLHIDTVRRHLQAGKLRGIKRGRVWRVPESALMETTPPTPKTPAPTEE